MSTIVFHVDVLISPDGTITVTSDDIRGLVLETDTVGELRDELVRVAGSVLRSNRGLTDEDVGNSVLVLRSRLVPDPDCQQGRSKAASSLTRHAPALAYA